MSRKDDLPEEPFDPDNERPAEADELDFSDDEEPSFKNLSPDQNSPAAEIIDEQYKSAANNNIDDVEPEDLIKEDGARSPHESTADYPADKELTIVNADDIGAGYGLDEAELARAQPLDHHKPLHKAT